jgi:hypothetical protein
VAAAQHRNRGPNTALIRLIEASGASKKSLAHRINQLAKQAGHDARYTHTSVANWAMRGMIPKAPIPSLIAVALSERLARPVTLTEIGMGSLPAQGTGMGLSFSRDPADAVRVACTFWSAVNRRQFASRTFAIAAFVTPVTRWLVTPAAAATTRRAGARVGRTDLDELWQAADDARAWDSKYGGGNWRSNAITDCLRERAAPLLHGSYSDDIGRELYAVTAELSRMAAWSAVDTGHHDVAQRHFVQALALARAGGNVEVGGYVLTTMALQTLLRGYPAEAVDMVRGAYERAQGTAAPRVLAFTRLIEARAHGRAGDARAAATAVGQCEALLGQADAHPDGEPEWISYMTHARMSADTTEIFRDLHRPAEALAWNDRAAAMAPGVYTRSVGMRLAIAGTAHLQARDLDHGLQLGNQAVDILARVQSTRALDYVRDFNTGLDPWSLEGTVQDFRHRARTELAMAS